MCRIPLFKRIYNGKRWPESQEDGVRIRFVSAQRRLGRGQSVQAIAEFQKLVLRYSTIDREATWRQYRGLRSGQIFAGVAEQANEIHGLLDVSGEESHAMMTWEAPRGLEVKCTRLDLQITIPIEKEYEYRARDFKDALEQTDWSSANCIRIHKRRLKLVEGPTEEGLDTLYIGSRSSDRLARVYVKEDVDGDQYLRFEVEFKSARAELVFRTCVDDGKNVAAILKGEWDRIPPVEIPAWKQIGSVLAEYMSGMHVSVPRSATEKASRYVWFVETVARKPCAPGLHQRAPARRVEDRRSSGCMG